MTDNRKNTTDQLQTNYLNRAENASPMPARVTQPLDYTLPSALRFILGNMSAVLEVPLKPYMVVGRKNSERDTQVDVDLSPFEAHRYGVSRYHAIILITNGRISIKDFNSTNGTYLNDFILQPMHAYRLRHGDELKLGELALTVHFVGVSAPNGG